MKKTFNQLVSFAVATSMMLVVLPNLALAATPQNAKDNMTRQKAGLASDHHFSFVMPTATAADVVITFPALFDVTGATGGTVSGQTVTIAGPVSTAEVFDFTLGNIINPSVSGNYSIGIASDVDSGSVLVPIIDEDQIFVTAKVAQTLSFDVQDSDNNDNTVGFGELDSTNTRYATTTSGGTAEVVGGSSKLFIATNAPGGYAIDVDGDTLRSMENPSKTLAALAGATPAAAGTAEQFGMTVDVVTGTGSINPTYTGVNYDLPTLGTPDLIIQKNVPTLVEEYGVNYVANITSLTPAGNYATALTYTATANF